MDSLCKNIHFLKMIYGIIFLIHLNVPKKGDFSFDSLGSSASLKFTGKR